MCLGTADENLITKGSVGLQIQTAFRLSIAIPSPPCPSWFLLSTHCVCTVPSLERWTALYVILQAGLGEARFPQEILSVVAALSVCSRIF